MGSSLGPVLADIIMTELEDVINKPLIADGTIKFHSRFVDDTLLLGKFHCDGLHFTNFNRLEKTGCCTYILFMGTLNYGNSKRQKGKTAITLHSINEAF